MRLFLLVGMHEIAIRLITALHPSIAKLDVVKAPRHERTAPPRTIRKDGSFADDGSGGE